MTTSVTPTPRIPSVRECEDIICTPGSPFERITVEIDGRPTLVWKNSPTSFRTYLLERMERHADKVCVNTPAPEPRPFTERELVTFGQVHKQALAVAAWLRARGVRQNTNVGVVGYNCAGWIVAWVATHLLGAVPVMVNAAVVPDSMVHCLKLTKPLVVLTDATTAATLSFHRQALADGGVTDIVSWQNTDHLKTGSKVDVIDFAKLEMPAQSIRDVVDGKGFGIEEQHPESNGVIFFTSGTTGYPKAVVSSQRAALHSVVSGSYGFVRAGLRAGLSLKDTLAMMNVPPPKPPVCLMAVPFFHVTGAGVLIKAIADGIPMVLMRRWDVDEAIKLMIKYNVTTTTGVPAIILAIMQSPKLPKDFVLQGMGYGGAPAPDRLPLDIKKRWPQAGMGTAWGMTETNAAHTSVAGEDYLQRPKSAGTALPIAEVRIVDSETKEPLPIGAKGLIQARGMTLMKGYYNDEEATRKAIDKDGWLDTGDAGYLDEDGFLYIADRIKDIIIRGGENISSEEVENAIYLDDRVAEAAAVPVPHNIMGEEVAVAVSLREGVKATPEDIIAAVHKRLRPHARPVFVWVSDELLPRNANGKLIKTDIKKIVQDLYAKSKSSRAKL